MTFPIFIFIELFLILKQFLYCSIFTHGCHGKHTFFILGIDKKKIFFCFFNFHPLKNNNTINTHTNTQKELGTLGKNVVIEKC